MRESDILIHVADISHPDLEEQIDVVKQTLVDLKAADKPTIMLFNKIDVYKSVPKDADDLTPPDKTNLTLADLEKLWIARENTPSVFISATKKIQVDTFRELLYQEVKKIQQTRWPARG